MRRFAGDVAQADDITLLALSATTIAAFEAGAADSLALAGLWGAIGVGCAVATWLLPAHLRGTTATEAPSPAAVS